MNEIFLLINTMKKFNSGVVSLWKFGWGYWEILFSMVKQEKSLRNWDDLRKTTFLKWCRRVIDLVTWSILALFVNWKTDQIPNEQKRTVPAWNTVELRFFHFNVFYYFWMDFSLKISQKIRVSNLKPQNFHENLWIEVRISNFFVNFLKFLGSELNFFFTKSSGF